MPLSDVLQNGGGDERDTLLKAETGRRAGTNISAPEGVGTQVATEIRGKRKLRAMSERILQ